MIRIMLLLSVGLLLGAQPLLSAQFNHAWHLENVSVATCAACHKADAPEIRPETGACLDCHDQAFVDAVQFAGLTTHSATWPLTHREAAVGKTIDCSACHEQDFCLECHKSGRADEMGKLNNTLTNVHRSDFSVTHPIAARTNPQLCNKCHENKFCVECHEDFAPADLSVQSHRRGWSDLSVGAATHADFRPDSCQSCHKDSVLPSHEWSASHAREARKNLATCQACHPDGDKCLRCHSARGGLAVNPHPRDWNDIKNRLKRAGDGKTCRKCH